MSTEELEKLGIIDVSTKVYPRRYFLPTVGEFKIPEYYTFDEIFLMVYEKGIKDGIEQGKEEKINELKKILDIPTRD